jgi:prephenate dehydratase
MTAPDGGTVAIIGLGLIGGSLARDLSSAGVRVIGYDRDALTLERAAAAGVVAAPLDESLRGLDEADIIVLAVPVDAARALLDLIRVRAANARLITDVGSTKSAIASVAAAKGVADRFVGAHPLVGDDRAGWVASRTGLFAGARVYLCPTASASRGAVELAERLWRTVGAHTEPIDAHTHDRSLAWISHLPQLLATSLAIALDDAGFRPGDLGPGGRSMTRLAASSPAMWGAIAATNRTLISDALAGLERTLARATATLQRGEPEELEAFFDNGRRWAASTANDGGAARDVATTGTANGDAAGNHPVVAFQGELGAHSEEAVRSFFGDAVRPLPCRSFADVADAVMDGRATSGLLPVENTTAGSVVAAYEVLARSGLTVLGETVRPIRHALLGVPGAAPARVRRVLSHPVALAQCSAFFAERRWIEAVAYYDTAGAAREVARAGDPSVAALAARDAAARYGLTILAEDVHDRSDNRTRFCVIAREGCALPAGAGPRNGARMKSALLLDVANRPGALAHALVPFARRGVNLTHIQSTPGDAAFTYRFIIDIDGDARTGAAAEAIADVRRDGAELRVLGCFAVAAEPVVATIGVAAAVGGADS